MKRFIDAEWAWPATLGIAAFLGTLVFACLMPFAALAAVAAATMRMRTAAWVVGLCWLGKQALGFGLLNYPHDLSTVLNGLSLLAAGLLALLAAYFVQQRQSLGMMAGGLAGFAAFEGSLFLLALAQGDVAMFAPHIVALVAANEALWLVALWLLAEVVRRLAPDWIRSSARLAA